MPDDADDLDQDEERADLDDARAALAEVEAEGTVSWEKVKADLNL
jgi:hypothetical protein